MIIFIWTTVAGWETFKAFIQEIYKAAKTFCYSVTNGHLLRPGRKFWQGRTMAPAGAEGVEGTQCASVIPIPVIVSHV